MTEFPKVKLNKAVTMVELLVVMLIFVIIASIGVQAITDFRRGIEMASALSQFESMVVTVRNNARNNVLSRVGEAETVDFESLDPNKIFKRLMDGYLIVFSADTYTVRTCKKDNIFIDCSTLEPVFSPDEFNIKFLPYSNGSIGECHAVFYEPLSGNMKVLITASSEYSALESSALNDETLCLVRLEHKNSKNRYQVFQFDALRNTFERYEL